MVLFLKFNVVVCARAYIYNYIIWLKCVFGGYVVDNSTSKRALQECIVAI